MIHLAPKPHPPFGEKVLALLLSRFLLQIKPRHSRAQIIRAAMPEGFLKHDRKAFQLIIRWTMPAKAKAMPDHSCREFIV